MKISNEREPQQFAINHYPVVDFKHFINIYKDYTTEPYCFLVNDTTLPSDNPLGFRKNLLKEIYKKSRQLTNDQIKDEKLQFDIAREAPKILAYLSGKIININKSTIILQEQKYYLLIR